LLIGVIILAISIFASSVIPLVISEIVFRDSLVEKTKSPDTPTDTLIELGKHSKLEVRLAVAGNPNTPEEVLRKLYEEKNENNIYILYLTKNPSLPEGLREELKTIRAKLQEEF